VVTGSAGTGGTQDFTSAFGSTISVAISNAAVTLSDGQMPNHYHSSAFANASHATLRNYLSKTGDTNDGGFNTDAKGSSNPHTHSNTLSGVGSSASTYNLAVKYVDVIIASKD
jgi:microcystin-dependent protein